MHNFSSEKKREAALPPAEVILDAKLRTAFARRTDKK